MLDSTVPGAMALTGQSDDASAESPAAMFALLGSVVAELSAATGVHADPGVVLAGRAAPAGLTRQVCARLPGLAGARVMEVEALDRPDPAPLSG